MTLLSCHISSWLRETSVYAPQLHTRQAPEKTTTQLLHMAAPLNLALINPERCSIRMT
mgnify:CR=1 FL=1